MKHYHHKKDLSDNDVLYVVVKKGDKFIVKLDSEFYKNEDHEKFMQGVKLWLNRCRVEVSEKEVSTGSVILWDLRKDSTITVSNEHTHFFAPYEYSFRVINTEGEKPNIGFFNVWSTDGEKCYELTEENWMKIKQSVNTWSVEVHNGFEKRDIVTLKFGLIRAD